MNPLASISRNPRPWIYAVAGTFIAANAVALYLEFFWLAVLPILVILLAVALLRLDRLVLFIAFCTPLSLSLQAMNIDIGVDLALPTEPLLFGVLLLFVLKLLYEGKYPVEVLKHPITWAIFLNLGWMFVTCITSEMPLVSFKYLLSRMWFVTGFFFFGVVLFKDRKNLTVFLWAYIIPLTGVVLYTVIHHWLNGFEEKPAHWVMQPFFKDHTSYGAILAMFFPFLVGSLWMKKLSFTVKIAIGLVIVVFALGIIFSYTRAAWVSLLGAFAIFLIMYFRVQFKYLALAGIGVLIALFAFQTEITQKLEKNDQDSSDELAEHVESISNIATDASNLERLNRWSCAVKMWQERPIVGWGPGTYMFLYAPYQHSQDLTIISTNFGDLGNAHSEYLGPLSESGVLGMLTVLLILVLVAWSSVRLYHRLDDPDLKIILMGAWLGLVTYFIHGVLNNYLDTDKASVPFWGMVAIIVSIEVWHRKKSVVE